MMGPSRLARSVLVGRDGVLRAPWRIAVFAVAVSATVIFTTGVFYPLLALTPAVGWARLWRIPLDQYLVLGALVVATAAAYRLGERRARTPWHEVGLGASSFGWRPLLIGALAGAAGITIPAALLLLTGHYTFEAQPVVQSWGRIAAEGLMLLAPAAMVEELALRGYLLSTLRSALGTPWAVALTSVAFALLHLFNPDPSLLSTAVVALAGFFLAAVRLTTGSLWAAWSAHLLWNAVQAVVLHAPVSGLALGTPGYRLVDHGPAWLTGGTWGPEGGAAAAGGLLVTTFLLVWRRAVGVELRAAVARNPGEN
jgi:membrane protease YdiL (CAAX protease family)